MADRIFPIKHRDKLDSSKILNLVNWDAVEKATKLAQSSNLSDTKDHEDFSDTDDMFDDEMFDNSDVDDDTDDEAGKSTEGNLSKYKDNLDLDDEMSEDSSSPSDTDIKKMSFSKNEDFFKILKEKKMSKEKKIKKIANPSLPSVTSSKVVNFTDPSQLTAEAVEKAIESNDPKLVKTILAARHQRRVAIAQKIQESRKEEYSKIQDRKAFRNSVVKTASETAELLNKTVYDAANEPAPAAVKSGFKSISDLNVQEKDIFTKVAQSNGFPKEYIEAMLAVDDTDLSSTAKSLKELIDTKDINKEAKASVIARTLRVAELSDRDLSYLKDYWLNALGYGAKDWVDSLFSDKYYQK